MKKICIDLGHGGGTGARNGKYIEDDWINVTGKQLAYILRQSGFNVKLTRTENKFISLSERTKIANAFGCDLFISIHFNAGGGTGFECIRTMRDNVVTTTIAKKIMSKLSRIGHVSRPTPIYTRIGSGNKDYFSVLRGTSCPAMILEGAFVDNTKDVAIFKDEAKLKELGLIYAEAVCEYYGVKVKYTQNTPTVAPVQKEESIKEEHNTAIGTVNTKDQNMELGLLNLPNKDAYILGSVKTGTVLQILYKNGDYLAVKVKNSVKETGVAFVNAKYVAH